MLPHHDEADEQGEDSQTEQKANKHGHAALLADDVGIRSMIVSMPNDASPFQPEARSFLDGGFPASYNHYVTPAFTISYGQLAVRGHDAA